MISEIKLNEKILRKIITYEDVIEYYQGIEYEEFAKHKKEEWDGMDTDTPYLEYLYSFKFTPSEVISYEQFKKEKYDVFRFAEYSHINQMEYIFDHGFDGWKTKIQEIKDTYPKI